MFSCVSPQIFRARLRQFPSLVNCCTIDWFSEWPKTALESVALHFFNTMGELTSASDEIILAIVVCTQGYTSSYEKLLLLELALYDVPVH